jgi:hypothetical protein
VHGVHLCEIAATKCLLYRVHSVAAHSAARGSSSYDQAGEHNAFFSVLTLLRSPRKRSWSPIAQRPSSRARARVSRGQWRSPVQTRHAYLVVFKEWKASSKLWPRSKLWSLYRARLPTDPDEARLTCRIKHALIAL